MLETILSMLIGAFITLYTSRHYYEKSGNELKAEAVRSRKINEMILRWLEVDGNHITVVRDDAGHPVSFERVVEHCECIQGSVDVAGLSIDRQV